TPPAFFSPDCRLPTHPHGSGRQTAPCYSCPDRGSGYPEETTRSPLKQVPTLVSADDVTAHILLRTPRSGIFAPLRLSVSDHQTPLCWGVACTCSRWEGKARSASYFQAPLM